MMKNWSRSTWILIVGIIITLLFSYLLFDTKMSIGGDDSEYLISAKKFWDGKTFPTWHGSFYPILLSLFYGLFGMNVILFKILSLLFLIGHFYFFYKAFEDVGSKEIFYYTILLISINSYILIYASLTYSETFFMFLQALTFYILFKIIEKNQLNFWDKKGLWIMMGLGIFLMSITRNIGIVIFIQHRIKLAFRI